MRTRSFCILLVPVLLALEVSSAESRTCQVSQIEGADVRYEASGQWNALTTTDLPDGATQIATGADTRVRIVCDDRIVVTIGPATELALHSLAGPSGSTVDIVLELASGIVGILAPERTWRLFEVRTPLAIASVRSTQWLTEHGETETAVFVRRGSVAVSTVNGAANLVEGAGVTVEARAGTVTLGDVKQWSAARIGRSTGALGFDWQ